MAANTDYDVLEEHHRKNPPAKAPLFRFLDSDDGDDVSNKSSSGSDVDSDDEPADEPPARASRHSKKPFKAHSDDPTQLHFYPDAWQEALTNAKQNWRLWMCTNWGFPKFRERTTEMKDCLTRAITKYQEEGGALDSGECFVSHFSFFLIILQVTIPNTSNRW